MGPYIPSIAAFEAALNIQWPVEVSYAGQSALSHFCDTGRMVQGLVAASRVNYGLCPLFSISVAMIGEILIVFQAIL